MKPLGEMIKENVTQMGNFPTLSSDSGHTEDKFDFVTISTNDPNEKTNLETELNIDTGKIQTVKQEDSLKEFVLIDQEQKESTSPKREDTV